MWYDADIDAKMARTRARPVPVRARVAREEALGLGVTLSVLSVLLMALARELCSPPALLAFTIFFYAVVYTMWLKRSDAAEHRHRRACRRAAAGDRLGGEDRRRSRLDPLLLVAIIFMWTPPHFWALRALSARTTTRPPACRCCR